MNGQEAVICPSCGHRGPEGSACAACGRPLHARPSHPPASFRCPACGSTAAGPLSARCPSCGLSLGRHRDDPGPADEPPDRRRRLVAAALGLVAVLVLGAVLVLRGSDAPTLEAAWRVRFSGRVAGPVAVDGRTVVVTTRAGTVIGVDPADGRARWRFEAAAPALGPAVAGDGTAFLAGAGEEQRAVIFAIDTRTGAERWRVTTELTSPRGLAAGDGVLHVAGGEIVTIDALTGSERWRRRVEGASGAVSAGDGLLAVVTREGVAGYDSATGAPRWTWQSPQRPSRPPAVGDGIVVTDDGASTVVAVDARTGGERWRVRAGELTQAPVVAGPLAVLATVDGAMALDAATGDVLWRRGPSGRDDLRVGGDGTHVAQLADDLVARVAATGESLGRSPVDGRPSDPQPPVVIGSVVVVVIEGALQGHPLR